MCNTLTTLGTDPFGGAPQLTASMRQASIDRMLLQPGQRVLNAGCGAGDDTALLAGHIGASGHVYGVDYDAAMIARARQRGSPAAACASISYHHANATALPWPDDYFHATRGDRIFQEMLEPERAFDELLRVTQPGGCIVIISGDWASLAVTSDEIDIERRLPHFKLALASRGDAPGTRLRELFNNRGLEDICVDFASVFADDPVARSFTAAHAHECWQRSVGPEAVASGLFASANVVIVSGRKTQAASSRRS